MRDSVRAFLSAQYCVTMRKVLEISVARFARKNETFCLVFKHSAQDEEEDEERGFSC